MPVLNEYQGTSDVLKIENRSSEPFDLTLDPSTIDTIAFNLGQVAAVDADGYAVRGDATDLATTSLVGLFVLSRDPESALKNDYVASSGNASIFSSGIVVLDTQISDATVTAGNSLYVGTDGQITKTAPSPTYAIPAEPTSAEIEAARELALSSYIGKALSSRSTAGDPVRVKLEL